MNKILILLVVLLSGFTTPLVAQKSSAMLMKHFSSFYSISGETVDSVKLKKDQADFFEFIQTLKSKITGKNRKKNLKKIFDAVHNKYFVQYIRNPFFHEIFSTGQYNCLTASAIYSLTFEHLNIPYEIREKPTHVYVIAYPQDLNIIVESTIPAEGVLEYKKSEIKKYKKKLIKNKIIAKEELDDNMIWNKFILSDSIIAIEKINGLLLYNLALNKLIDEKYDTAMEVLHEANRDYYSTSVNDLYYYATLKYLNKPANSNPIAVCNAIYHLFKVDKKEVTTYLFSVKMAKELILETSYANDAVKLQALSKCAQNRIDNDEFNKNLSQNIDLATTQLYYNQTKFDSAFYFVSKSFDPKKTENYNFVSHVISQYLWTISDYEKVIQELESIENKFNFIKTDSRVQTIGIYAYTNIIYTEFQLNEKTKGLKFLSKFKKKYNPNSSLKYDPELIGSGFGAASAYHVRKNDYRMAIKILKKGLEYAPNSLELRRKLKLINKHGR